MKCAYKMESQCASNPHRMKQFWDQIWSAKKTFPCHCTNVFAYKTFPLFPKHSMKYVGMTLVRMHYLNFELDVEKILTKQSVKYVGMTSEDVLP